MRKVMRSIVVGVTFSVGGFGWTGLPGEPPAAHAQEAIPWMTNLDQARQVAQQNQRLVLIHFWNDNCAPCVGVDRNVFSRPEVARGLAANYVPVKIKVDDQPELARRLRVDRWPLDIIITPEGQELFRSVSPQDPVRYLTVTDRVAATARQALAAAAAPHSAPESTTIAGNPNVPPGANFVPVNYGSPAGSPGSPPAGPPASPPAASNPALYNPTAGPYGGYAPAGAVPTNMPPSGAVPATGPYGAAPVPTQPAPPPSSIPGGQFIAPGAGAVPPGADRSAFNPNAMPPNSGMNSAPGAAQSQFAMANGTGGPPPASFASASQTGYAPAPSTPNLPNYSGAPSPAPAAASNPPLGLDGFCPVTLYEKKKWKRADARWGVVHRDRTYLFAGPEEQKKFLTSPDKFSPMLSGFDPVHYLDEGKLVTGRREHGVWYQDQMFLFADEASLQQFWTAPGRYIPRVEQAMRNTATSGLTQR